LRLLRLRAEVNDRDDFAAEVDDALHVVWDLGDWGDGEEADDFPDFEDRDAVGFAAEEEGQVFACDLGEAVFLGRGIRRC